MSSRNRFHDTPYTKRASEEGPCIFISHRFADKNEARNIVKYIQDFDLDVYFDENDLVLQAADRVTNHKLVVERIELGLSRSTHLLGMLTVNTAGSWWVPYEIGFAKAGGKKCAHLVEANIENLPSYIYTADVIVDRGSLVNWLPLSGLIKKGAYSQPHLLRSSTFVPEKRVKPIIPT